MNRKKVYYLFLLPSVILFTFTILIPFLSGIHIAFTNWDGVSKAYEYVGLRNFARIFRDKKVILPIRTTFLYAFCYTGLNNILALSLALLLNQKIKGQKFFETVFFVPMALSAVLAAFVWSFIYKDVFNELFGINSLIGNPKTALAGIILMALWNTVGSNMMIYTAGLNNISDDYYEAAAIDGAGGLSRFRYITLPMLMPSFTICITLTFTTALREFGTVMAATGGGPAGSTETLAIYIYRNLFSFQKAGYGQAVAILFMFLLVIIGTVLTRFFRSREVDI